GIAGQAAMRLNRHAASRKDRNTVPTLLAVPDRAIAGGLERTFGKALLRRLQLLQTDHVRPALLQPGEQRRQAAVDTVDVECRDLHPPAASPPARTRLTASGRRDRPRQI